MSFIPLLKKIKSKASNVGLGTNLACYRRARRWAQTLLFFFFVFLALKKNKIIMSIHLFSSFDMILK